MKLNQLITRIIISSAFGIINVLIYNKLLAEVKPTDVIHFSNTMNVVWKSMPPILVFLKSAVLCLIVISIPVFLKNRKSKQVIVSVAIGLALVLMSSILNTKLTHKRSEYKTFNTNQVVGLYEKLLANGDIEWISKIAVHPNLPDSIQEKLSGSEHMEIRRSIAYETVSKEILRNLAVDKEWEVRLAVALNKITPKEVVVKLQDDTNENVRTIANSVIQN